MTGHSFTTFPIQNQSQEQQCQIYIVTGVFIAEILPLLFAIIPLEVAEQANEEELKPVEIELSYRKLQPQTIDVVSRHIDLIIIIFSLQHNHITPVPYQPLSVSP